MMSERRERIAVVGAGLMGTSIALDWARAGFAVTIYDSDRDRVDSTTRRAREIGQALVEGGVISANELNLAVARMTATADLGEAVGEADYVAEAIVEDLVVKQALYAELDAITRPEAVLASNTSSLMPSRRPPGCSARPARRRPCCARKYPASSRTGSSQRCCARRWRWSKTASARWRTWTPWSAWGSGGGWRRSGRSPSATWPGWTSGRQSPATSILRSAT